MVETSYSYFSKLKLNLIKFKAGGNGVLKRIRVAIYHMRCIDLDKNTLKILVTHFSYNEKFKEVKKFYKTVTDIQWVLKIWCYKRKPLYLKQ